MNFHQIHSNFYLSSAVLLLAVIAYKIKGSQRRSDCQLLLGIFATLFRICSILSCWAFPYQDYNIYFSVLAYTTQSILIFAEIVKISSKSERDQSCQQQKLVMNNYTGYKLFATENKDGFLLLGFWNFSLYFFMIPIQFVNIPMSSSFGILFLVVSYWMTAGYFYRGIKEENKTKSDMTITCLIMLGFIHLLTTLFDAYMIRYQTAINGALYICEVTAIFNIIDFANLNNKEQPQKFNEVLYV